MLSENRCDKYQVPITYAVKHKDNDIRMASRSGGIFTALSDKVLSNSGVVYGCIINEDFMAIHIRADNIKDRNLMRGSKYIQSEMKDIFHEVENDLKNEREVLFSGTSCQIAGLLSFLGKNYEKLLCVDIVCHGVPSPLVWKDYLKWQKKKNMSEIEHVDFRNKKEFGWKDHVETIYFKNGKIINTRVFKALFYGHTILRPCCYKCPFKDIIHPGNLTIADYWGIEQAAPGFDDNKGVSLVLVNDEKGMNYFNACKECLEIRNTKIEDSIQPALQAPFNEPGNRKEFWKNYKESGFDLIARKYGGYGYLAIIKRKIKGLYRRLNKIKR